MIPECLPGVFHLREIEATTSMEMPLLCHLLDPMILAAEAQIATAMF